MSAILKHESDSTSRSDSKVWGMIIRGQPFDIKCVWGVGEACLIFSEKKVFGVQ